MLLEFMENFKVAKNVFFFFFLYFFLLFCVCHHYLSGFRTEFRFSPLLRVLDISREKNQTKQKLMYVFIVQRFFFNRAVSAVCLLNYLVIYPHSKYSVGYRSYCCVLGSLIFMCTVNLSRIVFLSRRISFFLCIGMLIMLMRVLNCTSLNMSQSTPAPKEFVNSVGFISKYIFF